MGGTEEMIDPIPQGYITLPEAVSRLTAHIADAEVRLPEIIPEQFVGAPPWAKRELALLKLCVALRAEDLVAFVRDPAGSQMFRILPSEWMRCAFWREMIVGGQVRASVGEDIQRHDGRTLLIKTVALDNWLARERERRPQVTENDCRTWLEAKMRANPDHNPQPKHDWCREAQTKFGVSARAFERVWAEALARTGAAWGKSVEERGRKLPTQIKPEGPGYMPLYFAAQWIATSGGAVEINPCDVSLWENAFSQLLARISSGDVAVTGLRDSEREKIEGHIFAGIPVDYPFSDTPLDLLFSEELYLSACVYIDEEHWRRGFNDNLQTRHGCKWSHLMVLKSDVLRHWPFSVAEGAKNTAPMINKAGTPGRPTSMHLVQLEYRARWDRGEANVSIGAEAQVLSEWLRNTYPHAPPLTPKTIANRLRHEHQGRTKKTRK